MTVFRTRRGTVHAVNGVSLSLARGEIVGIVGESGSGKSTVVRSIIRLVRPPGQVIAGTVLLDGRDVMTMPRRDVRRLRGAGVGFIAQNPFGALNPVMRIEKQFANIVRAHRPASKDEIRELAVRLLTATGIREPDRVLKGYAHELSGGMAQRVVIAMALSLDPSLLIADEPTTALDLTVQRQILDTLRDVVRSANRSMLLVTHDLGVVSNYCDSVIVMYSGKVIETGPTRDVLDHPRHPYTQALVRAVPGAGAAPVELRGSLPDLIDYPPGCPYQPRCARAVPVCATAMPPTRPAGADRSVACHVPLEEGVVDAVASG